MVRGKSVKGGCGPPLFALYPRRLMAGLRRRIQSYRITPSSGELAVAYSFFGMRPAR